ncbi:MAG: hypothetical protein HQL76_17475 [Magnetococcales bacterium]|nr:hypothetical protein [Magnetococcales bacterium]
MDFVQTDLAPRAVGPYSQATRIGGWLHLSGQIALDPESGALVSGGVDVQIHQVMKNIGAVLKAVGAGYGELVKTTLYLIDLEDFAAVNEIYGQYVRIPYPARSTLGVTALPKGALVAVDGVAWLGK